MEENKNENSKTEKLEEEKPKKKKLEEEKPKKKKLEEEKPKKPRSKTEKISSFPPLPPMPKGLVMIEVETEIDSINLNERLALLKKQRNANYLFLYGVIVSIFFFVIWLLSAVKIFVDYQPSLRFFIALVDAVIVNILFVMFKLNVEKTQKTRNKREIFWMLVVVSLALLVLSFA